jgi:phage FluMu gp28-like protein
MACDQLFKDGFGGIAMEDQTLSEAVKLDYLVTYYQQYEDAGEARTQVANRFTRAIAILKDLQQAPSRRRSRSRPAHARRHARIPEAESLETRAGFERVTVRTCSAPV